MRILSYILLAGILSGCGDEVAYVANAVDLRVQFSEKLVSVHFDLSPEYHIQKNTRITFAQDDILLSRLVTTYDATEPKSTLGTVFSAENMLRQNWPTEDFEKFPNLQRLPKSVPAGTLKSLENDQPDMTAVALYQQEPYLIIGGALLSPDFTNLPPGFLAHQYFKDEYGSIVASISITGPTLLTKGGIYFLGNFGLNPFAIKDLRNNMHIRALGERMAVVSRGRGSLAWFSIFDLIRSLEQRLTIFEH